MSWYGPWYEGWYAPWFGETGNVPVVIPPPVTITPELFDAQFTDVSLRCDVVISSMSSDVVMSTIHADVIVPKCVLFRDNRRFIDPADEMGEISNLSEIVDGGASLTIEDVDYRADVIEMSMIEEST